MKMENKEDKENLDENFDKLNEILPIPCSQIPLQERLNKV